MANGDETEVVAEDRSRGRLLGRKLVLIVAAAVLVAAGTTGAVYWFAVAAPSATEIEQPQEPAKPVLYDAGEFVTNLADQRSRRFIQVEVRLEVEGGPTARELDEKQVRVRNEILAVLRSKTYSEVNGEEGMTRLAGEIVKRLNGVLEAGRVVNLYFTEFIVQ